MGFFGLTLDLMTPRTRRLGTEMNRETLRNVQLAGFLIISVQCVYLDIILSIRAVKVESEPPRLARGKYVVAARI